MSVEINDNNNGEIVIITKKGMAIRFLASNINPMGKIASGVTGISLKEDDEVIYGKYISKKNEDEIAITCERDKIFILTSLKKNIEKVKVTDIKLQNRAGRGTYIMMVSLDDEISDVQYN